MTVKRADVHGADYNPRRISDKARAKLAKGMQKLGMLEPITWNKRTGNIVGGHQRISVLDDYYGTPDYELTVSAVDLTPKQEKEANILLNNPEAQGEWALDKLEDMLADDLDLEAAGFDPADVFRVLGDDANVGADAAEAYASRVREALDAKANAATNVKDNSVDYYLVFVFRGKEERDEYLTEHGLDANKFQNGAWLAEKMQAVKPRPKPRAKRGRPSGGEGQAVEDSEK